MTNHLIAKTEYDVGDIIPLFEADLDDWYDWTVRLKQWYPVTGYYVYFLTRPGYEGWFTQSYLRAHISDYYYNK